MLSAERTLVERHHPFEHLALAHRLIDRRAVILLELADLLREPCALIEQLDQSLIDFVDLPAQTVESGAWRPLPSRFLP